MHITKNNSGCIREQDYIGFPVIQEQEIPKWNGVQIEQKIYGKKTIVKTKNNLDLSDCNLWYFIGRYIGDGWLRDNRKEVIICCAKKELSDLIEICKNASFNYYLSEEKTTYRFTISNVELYSYLKKFGKGAKLKHLTSDVFNLPITQLKAFIEGYISADGYKESKNIYRISTVSKELAFGIQQCIAKAYHQPTTITTRTPIDKIEGRNVKVSMCYSLSFRKEKCKSQHFIYENGYLWLPFRGKELKKEKLKVFNLSVKDDESYTVYNLACHNCTTFSMAGEREDSWGKKKKFREGQAEQTLDDLSFVFIDTVAKLRPKVVIMENVEGLLLGNAFEYVREIHRKFKEIGYNVMHKLLKGEEMGVPQTRHRVFFIATRLDFDFENLDLNFNYEPILYKDIKDGLGRICESGSKTYQLLCEAKIGEKDLCPAHKRLFGSEAFFQNKILYENEVVMTIRAKSNDFWCITDKKGMSPTEIVHSQTFPEDYEFLGFNLSNVTYICGMSVPPIMIKRIVNRLIESGIFDK